MNDLAIMAAAEWARANSGHEHDPVMFGHKVALAYLACRDTEHHAGDEQATAAALALLSVPSEIWQLLAQLSLLVPRSKREPDSPLHSGSSES